MSEQHFKKLNLGCGVDISEGWVNLDKAPLDGVDVVHDLDSGTLPFEADSFETILCNDILEHLDYILSSKNVTVCQFLVAS